MKLTIVRVNTADSMDTSIVNTLNKIMALNLIKHTINFQNRFKHRSGVQEMLIST